MRRILLIIVYSVILGLAAQAQGISIPEVKHPKNATVRKHIEEQRNDIDPRSKELLNKARELKRMDSTYYIPWMMEGLYYSEHATDYLGFTKANLSLRKAYNYITSDYGSYLKKRTGDIFEYFPLYDLHGDFSKIANALVESYSYRDMPDSAFAVVSDYARYNLQYEGHLISLDAKAWLVHRNRMYTSSKYYFLKSNIAENEALAHAYLDSSLVKINKDYSLNKNFLQPEYVTGLKYGIYHYKAILYGYGFQIDSALHYYDLMRSTPYFSNNNFGNLQMVRGNFQSSLEFYNKAAEDDAREKQLKEWAYFGSMLYLFDNKIDTSISRMSSMIREVGSTPGFGWYNIALVRSLNYGGNVYDVSSYLNKAEQFKELHIGTTLGATHYALSVALVKYHQLKNALYWEKFSDKGWWYKPTKWFAVAKYKLKLLFQKYAIIQLLKNNPEREEVIYRLFATESTVSWEEVLSALDGMNNNYFLKYYQDLEATDERKSVRYYFQYAQAKILVDEGKYEEAQPIISALKQDILNEPFDLMFRAKILMLDNEVNSSSNEEVVHQNLLELLYIYPQFLPFQGQSLNISIAATNLNADLLSALNKYHISWQNTEDATNNLAAVQLVQDGAQITLHIKYSEMEGMPSYEKAYVMDATSSDEELAQFVIERLFQIAQVED